MPAPRHRTDPSIRCHPHPVSHHHTCRCICSARRRRRSSLFSRSQSHIDVGTTAATTAASNPTNIRDMSPSPPGLPPSPRLHPLSTNPTADGRECKRRRERTATGAAALERDRDGHGRRGAERAAPPASQCLRLRGTARSAPSAPAPMPLPVSAAPAAAAAAAAAAGPTHRLRLVPHLDPRRSLRFDPIARDLPRRTRAAHRTKVVPRARAEVWVVGGAAGVKFCIRDTKSSSGTFLNHFRLLPANTESRSHQIKDGDILQTDAAPAPAAPAVPPRAAMGPPKPLADPKCDVLFGPLTWTKDHTGRHANIKADVANTLKEVFTQYNLNSVRFRTRCAHDAAYTICTFDTPAIADWLVIEWARVERGMYIDVTATH
ncbi:hypothetical protein C8J57DRAFT_1613077 [Mycena rebaudengoi]|nr:hypothetical protein C8J57DRAFT_1613077 [Mycena rebaudengoi]